MSRPDRVSAKREWHLHRAQNRHRERAPAGRSRDSARAHCERARNECRQICVPQRDKGTVAVTLKRIPGELRLTVSDDGKGLILDARIPGSAAAWSIPLRDSSAARSSGRAATREPSCV